MGDTFNYRKAYGRLRGGTLPELGGNFRLCAVDQKRPFFLRVGRFLDLLPFKGPFPLTGALTGRPPYGKGLLTERSLRGGLREVLSLKMQNPKSKTQKVFFPFALGKPPRTQNPKSKTQNPKSKTQNPKPKIQNPKSNILG